MNKKIKRFDDGGPVDPMEEANNSSAAQEIAGEEILKSMRDSEMPKQRAVSKAELEKSGLSLRDFLNREQGLTRRGDMAPKSAPKVTDTGDDMARMKARAPKPALRQETYGERSKAMYDEGQRVMAAKRAAAEEADSANDRNRQARILTGIKKKSDTNLGMGSTGLKKGGSVSKASSRGDGIATKGKTRGTMITMKNGGMC
jgi:hypothetical protein